MITILRQTALACTAIFVALLSARPAPPTWLLGLFALAGLLGLWETNRWVYQRLSMPVAEGESPSPLRVCATAMINLVTNLTLLNLTAHLALPGTFIRLPSGAVTVWDVLYFTILTFASGGYGDLIPGSALGKALSMVTMLVGFFYASTLCAAILQQSTLIRKP